MRRIILLVVVALALAGCGMDEAMQDTAASMGAGSGGFEVAVDEVKCDVHPWMNSNKAQVACILSLTDEHWDFMSDAPNTELYLSGVLEVSDSKFVFENDKPFSSLGTGSFPACQLKDWVPGLFYPCGLPYLELSAQLEGLRVPVEIIGVASSEGAKEFNVPASGENVLGEIESLQCEGEMIPDSDLANIIMIGELKDGQQIAGGGVMNVTILAAGNDAPMYDVCQEVKGGVVYEIETNFTLGLGQPADITLAFIADKETGRPIILGIVFSGPWF